MIKIIMISILMILIGFIFVLGLTNLSIIGESEKKQTTSPDFVPRSKPCGAGGAVRLFINDSLSDLNSKDGGVVDGGREDSSEYQIPSGPWEEDYIWGLDSIIYK